MIVTPIPDQPLFPIVSENPRPTIFEERDRIFWRAAHKYIKESPIEIQVNSAFWYIDKGLEEPDFQYGGGGFKYNFLFKTIEDNKSFSEGWMKIHKELKDA